MPTFRFTRRRFVAGGAAFGAVLSSPWRAGPAAQERGTRPLVPREILFGDPDRAWARLSHDRARDFRGSTLNVEAGAELVPGLAG